MRAKTAGRLIGSTWLAVAFVFANTTTPFAVTPTSAATTETVSFAPLKASPQSTAQAYLNPFFAFALSHAAARAVPRVKVAFEGRDVWLEPLALTVNGYSGIPVDEENAQISDEVVEFTRENVRDWTFVGQNQKIFGNFQTRALLSDLPPQTAAQIATVLSEQAIPANW